MQPQTFVFFGIVGSGKGTQVKLLQDFLMQKDAKEIVYAGPGEGFRKLAQSGSYTGKLVKEYTDKGLLVPDFVTNSFFTDTLVSSLSADKHLIVDGYPRTLIQSENLESAMKFYKRDNIKMIYIEVGREEAVKRNLLRGRHDDTEEGLKKRIDIYFNEVVPAMEYFKGKPGYEILSINGEQSVENVHKDIIKALGF